jgi:hypothetical protein
LLVKGRVLLDPDGRANPAIVAGTQNISGIENLPAIRFDFRYPDNGSVEGMHTPCQSFTELRSQLMLLACERLGQRANWTGGFGTADQKTELWRVCQKSVTAGGERSPTSASCRRATSS